MQTLTLEGFNVVGISVRTTNENGKARKDLAELFGKFMGGNLAEKITNKTSEHVYCLYTDYESDYMAPYTAIIGCSVPSLENIPDGFVGKLVPASKYQLYKSTGDLQKSVGETWMQIWKSDLNRKYQADFDIYSEGEVDTYVSVK